MAEKTEAEVAAEAKAAEKEAKRLARPLPALLSPTVNLAVEIRDIIAKRARELDESFSVRTNMLWLDFLKKEKLVPADLTVDLSPKKGAGLREKLAERETEIEELKKQVAELVASAKK